MTEAEHSSDRGAVEWREIDRDRVNYHEGEMGREEIMQRNRADSFRKPAEIRFMH